MVRFFSSWKVWAIIVFLAGLMLGGVVGSNSQSAIDDRAFQRYLELAEPEDTTVVYPSPRPPSVVFQS